jgi:alanine racemase
MNNHSRKTSSIINLPALVSNYKKLVNLAPKSETIAVIKANAYGHGAIEVAKTLSPHVPALAVAFIDEAIELRDAGITLPILIMEGALSHNDFSIALQQNFWLMLHTFEQVDWLNKLSPSYTGKLWLKVDTGMNRLGIKPNNVNSILAKLTSEQLENLVLCTHFSSSEELDNPKTLLQIAQFERINQEHCFKTSLANSAGILNWPQSHSDYNRLGLALYGASPIPTNDLPVKLIPVMTLQSTIIALRHVNTGESVGYGEIWQAKRPSVIATIAIGYADGYPRNAKNGTPVFIKGKIAPLAGRVSMDMLTIDVTDINNVELGDSVELWGKNLTIETVAEHLDTINYELLTRVSNRVTKVYVT